MLDAVQQQISMVQKIQKINENPRLQIVEVPEIQMFDDTQTSESLGAAPVVCQVAQVENVEVIEIGVPLPAESAPPMSFTAPVLQVLPVVVEYIQPVPVAEHAEPAPAHAVTFARAAPVVECAAPSASCHVCNASACGHIRGVSVASHVHGGSTSGHLCDGSASSGQRDALGCTRSIHRDIRRPRSSGYPSRDVFTATSRIVLPTIARDRV